MGIMKAQSWDQVGIKKIKVKPLKFNNIEIRDFISDFSYLDKEGKIKQKKHSLTPINVPKNSRLKGLHLYQGKDKKGNISKDKYFYVIYKVIGSKKTTWFPLGKFIPSQYGVKEVEDELIELNKKHTDNKGRWISCPLKAKRKAKTIITKEEAIEKRKEPVSRVVEAYCKAGFPRATFGGTLVAKVIEKRARVIIGYNHRKKHLTYRNDNNGNGHVGFKINTSNRTIAPSNWDDLFKKNPSGLKIERDKNLNPNKCISIYDDPILSKTWIGDLDRDTIKDYIRQFKSESAKRDAIECFNLIYCFACNEGYLGVSEDKNPAYKYRPKKDRSKPRHKYYKKAFTKPQLKLVCDKADELRERFPFQAELIRLMAITGIRREEACKLWKTDIRWDLGEIVLRPGITKSGREEFCTITGPVKIILEETLAYKKSEEHGEYYRLIPWLFGTAHTKLNKEKLFDKAYRNSDQTRLKTDVKCWKAIREELGWELCTSKMLRKSYGQSSQRQLKGRSDKSIRLMRQSTTEVFDKAYDGAEREEIKKDAHKVSELFDFIKRKTG